VQIGDLAAATDSLPTANAAAMSAATASSDTRIVSPLNVVLG
jgi:hypothetical protein